MFGVESYIIYAILTAVVLVILQLLIICKKGWLWGLISTIIILTGGNWGGTFIADIFKSTIQLIPQDKKLNYIIIVTGLNIIILVMGMPYIIMSQKYKKQIDHIKNVYNEETKKTEKQRKSFINKENRIAEVLRTKDLPYIEIPYDNQIIVTGSFLKEIENVSRALLEFEDALDKIHEEYIQSYKTINEYLIEVCKTFIITFFNFADTQLRIFNINGKPIGKNICENRIDTSCININKMDIDLMKKCNRSIIGSLNNQKENRYGDYMLVPITIEESCQFYIVVYLTNVNKFKLTLKGISWLKVEYIVSNKIEHYIANSKNRDLSIKKSQIERINFEIN